jgi:hypothetical protein
MWNNPWCDRGECHSTQGERPCGWWMSGADPHYNDEYALAIAGAIWPKAAVAAGAFYRFNVSLPQAELTWRVQALTDAMAWRGLNPCPCDAFEARKRCSFPPFMLKRITLPRQSRDKHRENSKTRPLSRRGEGRDARRRHAVARLT